MREDLRIAVLYGSSREGRFCDTVIDWLRAQLAPVADFQIDWIDPLALGLSDPFASAKEARLQHYLGRLDAADGFIIVTPEYNHGYPATIKHLIDLATNEWIAKPVGFVSYGGFSGGSRAVEQLRPVLAELSAVGIRETVSLRSQWDNLDENGALSAGPDVEQAVLRLVQQLRRWSVGLRSLRQSETATAAA